MDNNLTSTQYLCLLDMLRLLWRRRVVVLLPMLVFASMFAFYAIKADKWVATVTLRLANVSGVDGFESKKLTADYITAQAETYSMAMSLQGKDAQDFISNLTLTNGDKSDFVRLSVVMDEKAKAVAAVRFVLKDIIARHTLQYKEVTSKIERDIGISRQRVEKTQGILNGIYASKELSKSDSLNTTVNTYFNAQMQIALLADMGEQLERISKLETSLLSINSHNTEEIGGVSVNRSTSVISIVVFGALVGLCIGIFFALYKFGKRQP